MDQMGCTGCNRYIHLKSIFQRNNKDKKKNIRCFPHCCPARGGHKNTGFCGSSVFVTTDIPCDAAICRYESDTIDESRAIALGDVYDRSFIDSAGDYPAQRMVTEDGVIRFVVNPDVNKKGWSYPYDTRIEKNRLLHAAYPWEPNNLCELCTLSMVHNALDKDAKTYGRVARDRDEARCISSIVEIASTTPVAHFTLW
ncbi:unnamed protein product [Aphanomyces euteiches]